jgi:hypothetical protein
VTTAAVKPIEPPSDPPAAERRALGRALRKEAPRSAHALVEVPGGRDPLAILEAQSRTRLPALVPLRWTRMAASPFSFFRGAAGVMAADLAGSPGTGIDVQACGDAHLLNFGLYASPERTLMFDLNDFDETLRAPWEWDVKRLAASTVIAGRSAGLPSAATSLAAAEAIRRYGRTMARLATMSVLDAWSVSIDAAAAARSRTLRRATVRASRRATTRDHVHAFSKLTEVVDGQPRIRAHPPLVLRIEQILSAEELAYIDKVIEEHHRGYLETLRPDHRLLMERYRLVDFALKVVGTNPLLRRPPRRGQRSSAAHAGQGGPAVGARAARRALARGAPGRACRHGPADSAVHE